MLWLCVCGFGLRGNASVWVLWLLQACSLCCIVLVVWRIAPLLLCFDANAFDELRLLWFVLLVGLWVKSLCVCFGALCVRVCAARIFTMQAEMAVLTGADPQASLDLFGKGLTAEDAKVIGTHLASNTTVTTLRY